MEKLNLYKQMEERLESIPVVRPEAYFKMNDCARNVMVGERLVDEERNMLEMLYSELQSLEAELVSVLDEYRSLDVISPDEFLIVADYFLVSNQVGPESSMLKDFFIFSIGNSTAFAKALHSLSIPEHIRTVLQQVYLKTIL
jgi:hypothetical protein